MFLLRTDAWKQNFLFCWVCLGFFAMLKCETVPVGMLVGLTASLVASLLLCMKRRHPLLCCVQRALWGISFFSLESDTFFAFYSTDVVQDCV